MFRSTCLEFLCHVLCLDLCFYMFICLDLHAQGFYAMFPWFCSSFCFVLMLGLCAHMLDNMFMVMLCSDLCTRMLFAMFYAQICICTCLYVQIHILPCLCVKLLHAPTRFAHAYAQFYVYVLRSRFSHVCVLKSRFSHAYVLRSVLCLLCAIFHVLVHFMPCLCAQTQAVFVKPCAIIALLSLYLSFLCFDLLVWTRSRPYNLCHYPYTLAHIKGFGSPQFACLCLLASMLYACVSLSSSRLFHV